jgi:hypothetical protein
LSSRTAGQQKAVVISSAFGKDGAQLWSKMPQQICAALTVDYSGLIGSHKMFAILRAAHHTLHRIRISDESICKVCQFKW